MFTMRKVKKSTNLCELSPVKNSFDPVEIKKVVDKLVFKRFEDQFPRKYISLPSTSGSPSGSSGDEPKPTTSDVSSSSNEQYCRQIADSDDQSIGTCDLSLAISRSELNVDPSEMTYSSLDTSLYFEMDRLYAALARTTTQKNQILKAIYLENVERNTNVRIEAERLLIKLDVQESIYQDIVKNPFRHFKDLTESATLTLRNLRLEIGTLDNFHFMCLVTHNSEVYASEVVRAQLNRTVTFGKEMVVENFTPKSKLVVRFYAVKRSFNDLQRFLSKLCQLTRLSPRNIEVPTQRSIFKKIAEREFTVKDIKHLGSSQRIELNEFTGLINICKNPNHYPIWNMQWCTFYDRIVQYYNYPSDKTPIETIDIVDCVEIRSLRKLECPRGRSIMLKTKYNDIYLLCFNDIDDLYRWENAFDKILTTLKVWSSVL